MVFMVAVRSHRSRPFALLAQLTYDGSPGEESGLASSLGSSTLAYNGSPRRNGGQPHLSVSGALPPNPRQGPPPLDPAVLFSWSTGVAPRYPPDSAVPTPE